MNDSTRLWLLLAVFFACPAFGVSISIHDKLKKQRSAEIREIIDGANRAAQESVDVQVRGSREEAEAAAAAASQVQQDLSRATSDLARWKHANARALTEYAKTTARLTPHGAELLLDERLTLPDLIERVTRDAVGKRKGFQGMKIARRARGFEVTLTFARSLEWSEKTVIMEGIRQLRATLEPKWISDLRFSKPGGKPVSAGRLDGLTDSRLTALVSAYYTTKSLRLPDPNIVGRRTHPEAAWQITNSTGRHIAITYFGPEQGTVNLVPKQVKEVRFKPGSYFISVKATDTGSRVTPYSGQTTYKGGYLYASEWVIRTSYGPGFPTFPPYRPRRRRR